MKMVYALKPQARLSIDAQAAGERLTLIEDEHGKLTPELVVDDARKKSSPLHDGFEWSDSEAAEKYRLDQARYILRQIIIVPEPDKKAVRAFVSIDVEPSFEDDEEKVYTTINHAMSDVALRKQVLERAYKELQQWSARYDALSEFADVHRAIAKIRLKTTTKKGARNEKAKNRNR